jgi:NTP pyrophosphatase (non-canonical NTP hydrolase)
MELKEFQQLALRTESHIDGIRVNRQNLITLLKMTVALTEILDGIKKAAFYNKTQKLETYFVNHITSIGDMAKDLEWQSRAKGATEAIIDTKEFIPNVDPRVFHGILGIVTESGELAAALLKGVEDSNHTIDAVNVQEEMSDIAWYEAILHDTLKLDWGQGLTNVIEKLRIRYPDKYSDYHADNRNLEAERAALEVGVTTPSNATADSAYLRAKAGVSLMQAELIEEAAEVYNSEREILKRTAADQKISKTAVSFMCGFYDHDKAHGSLAQKLPELKEGHRKFFFIDVPDGFDEEALTEYLSNVPIMRITGQNTGPIEQIVTTKK